MARPVKLSAEVTDRICAALRAGATYQIAAEEAGIGYRTFARWMEVGQRARTGRFWQFWQTVSKAAADSALVHLRHINEQAPDDWRASAWVLQHRFPTDYGTVTQAKVGAGRPCGHGAAHERGGRAPPDPASGRHSDGIPPRFAGP